MHVFPLPPNMEVLDIYNLYIRLDHGKDGGAGVAKMHRQASAHTFYECRFEVRRAPFAFCVVNGHFKTSQSGSNQNRPL
jgi:hypothetical protein